MADSKIKCTGCGSDRAVRDYYYSASPFHKNTSKVHVCKQCIFDFVDDNDVESVKNMLRMIDKPFVVSLYSSSIEEAEKTNRTVIGTYMKNLGMKQYREKTWKDSEFGKDNEKIIINNVSTELLEAQQFWGSGFNDEDYIFLNDEYQDYLNKYEVDTKGMETLIEEICLTKLDIRKRRSAGEKVDQQLKTLQDLLGSSNLKPVQETGANAAEQESFGTLIRKYERERPIPEPDPKWKDVDGIGAYIRTFFFGHMAKAIGAENQFQDEYDQEVGKYTVKQEDGEEDGRV